MNASDHAIAFDRLTVRLDGQTILENVCAQVPRGRTTALIGPNGAGKTTLLRAIMRQIPFEGRLDIPRLDGRRPRLGYVPQRLDFDRGAPITVADFLCCDRQFRPLWLGQAGSARRKAREALQRVHVAHLLDRSLGVLSGGELQRVLLALALLIKPDILLLDEPVAGVDLAGQDLFCDLLASLQQQLGCTLLLISHDLSVVTQHADHVICLNRAVLCQGSTVDTLNDANLQAIYGPHVNLYHHHNAHEGAGHSHPAHTHGHEHCEGHHHHD